MKPDNKPTPDESRRDRVAINAMQALIGRYGVNGPSPGDAKLMAKAAYTYADAFIAVRGEGK